MSIFLRFLHSRIPTVNFPDVGTYRREKQMSPRYFRKQEKFCYLNSGEISCKNFFKKFNLQLHSLPQKPSQKCPKQRQFLFLPWPPWAIGLYVCLIAQGSQGKQSLCRCCGHFCDGFCGKFCSCKLDFINKTALKKMLKIQLYVFIADTVPK